MTGKRVSFKHIGKDEYKHNTLMRLDLEENYTIFTINKDEECIDVLYTLSRERGMMSLMIDLIISEFKWDTIRFIAPLSKEGMEEAAEIAKSELEGTPFTIDDMNMDRDISDALNNYERKTIPYGDEEVVAYVTEWE